MSNKTIIKATVDAWHNYSGYFSSIEEAINILPRCPQFRRALMYRKPTGMEGELPISFQFNSKTTTQGLRYYDYIITGEVKEGR